MSLRFNVRTTNFKRGGLALLALSGFMVTAVSLAPVSGAYFTDTKSASVSVSTASLGLAFAGDSGTLDFAFDGLQPGGVQTKTFTIKNTGTLTGSVKFVMDPIEVGEGQDPNPQQLHYSVNGEGFSTGFDANGDVVNLGPFNGGEEKTFTIDALLDTVAGNDWQGVTVTNAATVTMTQVVAQ